jgi:hypothetical protein
MVKTFRVDLPPIIKVTPRLKARPRQIPDHGCLIFLERLSSPSIFFQLALLLTPDHPRQLWLTLINRTETGRSIIFVSLPCSHTWFELTADSKPLIRIGMGLTQPI